MRNGSLVLILCIGGILLGCSDKTSERPKPAGKNFEGAKQAVSNTPVVYEKNGSPCVAELCIGDGISELKNIQWKSVEEKKIKRDDTLANVKLGLRGKIPAEAIPFLEARKFDTTVLPLISEITAACTSNFGASNDYSSLRGEYVSNTGNRTEVGIQLLPKSAGSSEQQWTVSYIRRFVETPMNSQDVAAAEHQLAERYKKFVQSNSYGYTGKADEIYLYRFNSASQGFYFDLQLKDRQPHMPSQCANKVNID